MAPKRKSASQAKTPRKASRLGERVEIAYSVPKTKRGCAGLQGAVVAETAQTVTVRPDGPADVIALFTDCLDGFGNVKISAKHAVAPRHHVDCYASPFGLPPFQMYLGEMLGWQTLLPVYATARGLFARDTLRSALRTAMRRTLKILGSKQRVYAYDLHLAMEEWSKWNTGTLLKQIGYGAVRDVMVDFYTTQWRGTGVIPWTAFKFLEHIGVRYDTKIIDMLMTYKASTPSLEHELWHVSISISHFLGTSGARSKAPLGDHTIVTLVKTVSRWSSATHRRDLLQVLELMHSGGERLAQILRGTCHEEALRVLILCIDNVFVSRSEKESVMISDSMESLTCKHSEIYLELIRILAEASTNVVELRTNRWMTEPAVLGQDVAGVWDPCIWSEYVDVFTCAVCLVRILPLHSLKPIFENMSDEANLAYTVQRCGYPGATTSYFTRIVSVFLNRDPTLKFGMLERLQETGDAMAQWLLRAMEVRPKNPKQRLF